MLALKPGCEWCDVDLPGNLSGAMICSFEMHILPGLRRTQTGWDLPKLCRQTRAATHALRRAIGEISREYRASL